MNENIKYRYDAERDRLHLASLSPERGKYETSWDITEDRPVGLLTDLTTEGRCIGVEFWNAAEQLLPHLLPDDFPKTGVKTALIVEYDRVSDTLHLHAGKPGNYSETVIEGLGRPLRHRQRPSRGMGHRRDSRHYAGVRR